MNMKLIITLAIAALSVLPLSAKKKVANLLPADVYGFEKTEKIWWTKYKDVFTVSTEKAASGEKSLKFSCADLSAIGDIPNIQIQGGNTKTSEGLVSLKPGAYTVSIKVWLSPEGAPKGFSTNLRKPFVPVAWKTKGVATGEWVELTQDITVEKAIEATNLVVSVSTNPKWGGAGTFYLDDITITK